MKAISNKAINESNTSNATLHLFYGEMTSRFQSQRDDSGSSSLSFFFLKRIRVDVNLRRSAISLTGRRIALML